MNANERLAKIDRAIRGVASKWSQSVCEFDDMYAEAMIAAWRELERNSTAPDSHLVRAAENSLRKIVDTELHPEKEKGTRRFTGTIGKVHSKPYGRPVSLDAITERVGDASKIRAVAEEAEDPSMSYHRAEIKTAIDALPERHRIAFVRRFNGDTFTDIARDMNEWPAEVRRLYLVAQSKLRQSLSELVNCAA